MMSRILKFGNIVLSQGRPTSQGLSHGSRLLFCSLLFWASLSAAAVPCFGVRRSPGSPGSGVVKSNPAKNFGVLAAALNSPACRKRVGPASAELSVFAARLGLGELRRTNSEGRFLHVPSQPAGAATSKAAEGKAQETGGQSGQAAAALHLRHQAALDFLKACPIYFVADAGGRLLTASYHAADPHVIPSLTAATTAATEAAATTGAAAAASTPAHAALSVGVYFMSPVDAADYMHAVTGVASRSPLTIRAVPLSEAYASLRYIHPKLRLEAAAPIISGKTSSLLRRLSLAVRQLLGWEARGAKVRCVVVPDTHTLSEEIAGQGGASFRGIPVFSLPAIKAERGSRLHTQLLQLQQSTSSTAMMKNGQHNHCYQLVPVERSPCHWVLAVQFEGNLRTPVFCSRNDAHAAYVAFAARLPPRLLAARATLRVHTLEEILDKLAVRASSPTTPNSKDTNTLGMMRPLLLPALDNFI
ncbi:hypothetical protein ACSSS7_001407 [Eimeria intestinalis]